MDWSRIPSLAALRAFEAAARNQSFSKAASELNVTHAAIAHHVRSLENEFSESLMVRQGRGIEATQVGARFAEDLQIGFASIADGVENLRALRDQRPLNIAVTPIFAANWLMPRIGDFWAKHPEISLNINPGVDLIDMRKSGTDLAIRYGNGNWPNLKSQLLTDGDFWVVAHPDLIGDRQVECLPDVIDLPWVMESQMLERRSLVEREGVDFGKVKLTLLNTNALVLSAVAAKLGISVQPKSIVEREIASGELVKICALNHENLGYYMVTVPDRQPAGLREFIKWLRANK